MNPERAEPPQVMELEGCACAGCRRRRFDLECVVTWGAIVVATASVWGSALWWWLR